MSDTAAAAGPSPGDEVASIRLWLRAEAAVAFGTEAPIFAIHGAIHAELRWALEGEDPVLVRGLHSDQDKALTLSPLYADTSALDDHDLIPVGQRVTLNQRVWLRLTALAPDPLRALRATLDGLLRAGRPLTVNGVPFAVEAVEPLPIPGGLPPVTTYAQLAGTTDPAAELVLRFLTPTMFRHKDVAIVEPDPRRVFASYLRRWRAASPVPLAGLDEAVLAERIRLVAKELRVERVRLHGRVHPGFVGWCCYRVDGPPVLRQAAATLAAYAAYCGTGARTSYGMGQTRRLR